MRAEEGGKDGADLIIPASRFSDLHGWEQLATMSPPPPFPNRRQAFKPPPPPPLSPLKQNLEVSDKALREDTGKGEV